MSKSEVYSWRLSPELKMKLEAAARREKSSLSELLDRITREWLRARTFGADAAEQEQLRAEMMKYAGCMELGAGPYTNRRVREIMGAALEAKHARRPRPR